MQVRKVEVRSHYDKAERHNIKYAYDTYGNSNRKRKVKNKLKTQLSIESFEELQNNNLNRLERRRVYSMLKNIAWLVICILFVLIFLNEVYFKATFWSI